MGEHQTWLDFLDLQSWSQNLGGSLGRNWRWMMFGDTHFTLIHVFFALLVVGFVLFGASRFSASVSQGGSAALIPPAKFNLRNLFEILCDAILSLMTGVMGEKAARKFFPLIGSLALFILFSNLLALVPGMGVPTTTLKTNIGLAMIVFFATHIYGIREHGVGNYFKHFLGPIWWLYPLIFVIELISHLVRPASLAIRLMGNMAGDHKVVFSFFTLVPLFVPVPFLLLGILVSVIQTLVFCLLSTVYISMAIAHDH